MRVLALVVVAGGIGSGLRYLTGLGMSRLAGDVYPWGTLIANVVGCVLIGAVTHLALEARVLSEQAGIAITTGFLGGLTTFSAYSLESLKMIERRQVGLAVLYALGSLVVGIASVWLGTRLGATLTGRS